MSAPVLSWLFTVEGAPKLRRASLLAVHGSTIFREESSSSDSAIRSDSLIPPPNPQSQSFSRSYGSILPTSLIYIILSTRGYEPWRPDAVMSTIGGENNSRNWIFKGRPKRSDRSKINLLYQNHTLPLRAILFRRVYVCKKEKITLLRARASVSSFA